MATRDFDPYDSDLDRLSEKIATEDIAALVAHLCQLVKDQADALRSALVGIGEERDLERVRQQAAEDLELTAAWYGGMAKRLTDEAARARS